jgi:hypothetical protein
MSRHLILTRMVPGPGLAHATGQVAEATVYDDGTAVLHWLTDPHATEVYPSEAGMRQVREISGRSWFSDADEAAEIRAGAARPHLETRNSDRSEDVQARLLRELWPGAVSDAAERRDFTSRLAARYPWMHALLGDLNEHSPGSITAEEGPEPLTWTIRVNPPGTLPPPVLRDSELAASPGRPEDPRTDAVVLLRFYDDDHGPCGSYTVSPGVRTVAVPVDAQEMTADFTPAGTSDRSELSDADVLDAAGRLLTRYGGTENGQMLTVVRATLDRVASRAREPGVTGTARRTAACGHSLATCHVSRCFRPDDASTAAKDGVL